MSNVRFAVVAVVLVAVSFIGVRIWLDWRTADDDPQRAKLREAVIETASDFRQSPCDEALEQKYLDAAAAYAHAFAVLGGCPEFPACRPGNDAMLKNAEKVFASPADARVRDAMRAVHDIGIRLKDYPGGLGLAIDHLSGSTARREGEFSCKGLPNAVPSAPPKVAAATAKSPTVKTATPNVVYIPMGELRPSVPASTARPPTRPELDRTARDHYRDAALQALRRPGPALCGATERGNFLAAMNQYYTQRDKAQHGMAVSRAEQAEAERAWSMPADLQIDGLVREFYTEGYLRPGDLQTSQTVEQVLAGIKPRHYVCPLAGKS